MKVEDASFYRRILLPTDISSSVKDPKFCGARQHFLIGATSFVLYIEVGIQMLLAIYIQCAY